MIINEFPLKYSLVDMEEVEAGVELKLEKKASFSIYVLQTQIQ